LIDSGGPYSQYYMVGGSSRKNTGVGMTWLKARPPRNCALNCP